MSDLAERARRGEPLGLPGIVDMHAHLGPWHKHPMLGTDADSMVRRMDRVGVERMMVSHHACVSGHVRYGNAQVLDAMRRHPGRILGYATVFPVTPELGIEELRRCFDAGMPALKIHDSNTIPYTSPLYEPIWAFADDHRMPVLLHGGLREAPELAPRYPNARILLGHAGAVRPAEYAECARRYPNVILDLASSGCRYRLVEFFVREVGAERVTWGTDMPWIPVEQQIGRVVFAEISEDEKRQILVENPRRLLERVR